MKKQLLAVIISGLLLSGCGKPGSYSGDIKDDTKDSENGGAPVVDIEGDSVEGSVTPGFVSLPEEVSDDRMASTLLNERVIFFEYDKSLVRNEDLPIISAHSDFLLNNADKSAVLSGHADERGSNEYNLALGQRRADAVKALMLSTGVNDSQLETFSFGEERPAVSGSNEDAWAQNRRVEIRYTDE